MSDNPTPTCLPLCLAVVEARGLSQAVARMRRITQQLPPCLVVPHTVKAWHAPCSSSSSSGSHQQCVPAIVAGEALATVGVSTLASLLQEVRTQGGVASVPLISWWGGAMVASAQELVSVELTLEDPN